MMGTDVAVDAGCKGQFTCVQGTVLIPLSMLNSPPPTVPRAAVLIL